MAAGDYEQIKRNALEVARDLRGVKDKLTGGASSTAEFAATRITLVVRALEEMEAAERRMNAGLTDIVKALREARGDDL